MRREGVSSAPLAVVVVVLAVALMAPGAAAQGTPAPACAQKLIPCGPYIRLTTKPPESCCGQIREAVKNELPCLCSLLSNKGLLQTLKIDLAQALALPKLCGVTSDTSICNNTTAAGGPTAPPATPGKDNGASAVGASVLVVLLALCWSLVA